MDGGDLRRNGWVGAWERAPATALAAALGALLFAAVFGGFGLASARHPYWTMPEGDLAQSLAGQLAGLREPWRLPFSVTRTLTAPDPVSIVYTDSLPWVTAVLKLTHLGPLLSGLGGFLLLAWIAQGAAMAAVLRAAGVRRTGALLAGAALALLAPTWLLRQLGHVALSGHAIQIAGLALAVHGLRAGVSTRLVGAFVALAMLATGIHAYHLPPLTLLFAAMLAGDALQRRPGAGARLVWGPPVYVGTVGLTAWALGYAVGRGGSGGVSALGYYEMNLWAPVWPQGSALAGQRWSGKWFTTPFDATGGEWYEGYAFLGFGVLALAAAAVALRMLRRAAASPPTGATAPAPAPAWRRWGPLAATLAMLALYAVGPKPHLGTWSLWAPPPPSGSWMEPLALFRSHGRFFWTPTYALIAWAIVTVDRWAGPRLRPALLAGAVAVQAADVSILLQGVRSHFTAPERLVVPAALAGPAFEGRDYRIFPGYFCTPSTLNHVAIAQLSVIAQRRHASTSSAETAREPPGSCTRAPTDALGDAAPGDRRITVLMADGVAPPLLARFAGRTDCYAYGPLRFCGRDLAGIPGLTAARAVEAAAPTHVDAEIAFSRRRNPVLLSGWSKPEPNGVWSEQRRAVLRLPHPDLAPGGRLVVSVQAFGYVPDARPPQRAWVSVAGERLAEWRLLGLGYQGYAVTIPARLLKPEAPLDLVLDMPDAFSPNTITPAAHDPRLLGIGMRSLRIAH